MHIFCRFVSYLDSFPLYLPFSPSLTFVPPSFSVLFFFLLFSFYTSVSGFFMLNFNSFVCDFSKFNLLLVASHELGHSLGLWHSKSRNSIMYPIYKYQNPRTFYLHVEHIQRMQQLYGLFHLEGRGSGQKNSLENFTNFSAPIRTKMFIWNAWTLAQNYLTWHFNGFLGGSKNSKQ